MDQTTGFAVGTFVRLFQDDLGGSVHRTVIAVDPVRSRLRWNAPLPAAWYVDPLTLTAPLSLETVEFGPTVYERGQPRESHPDLSLNPANTARFVETVINTASALIRVHCLQSAPAALDPGHWPDPTAETLHLGRLALAEGRDGTAALRVEDFTGRPDTTTLRGLRTVEAVDEVSLVAIPDILIRPLPPLAFQVPPSVPFDPCLPCPPPPAPAALPPPGPAEQPPVFDLDAVFAVQQAMVAHCELLKDRLAVLDPPWFESPVVGLEAALIQSWRERFDSKYAALYYPWLSVVDPLQRPAQPVRAIPLPVMCSASWRAPTPRPAFTPPRPTSLCAGFRAPPRPSPTPSRGLLQSPRHQLHPFPARPRRPCLRRPHRQPRSRVALCQRPPPPHDDRGSGRAIRPVGRL
ncbi:MAG: hypothetical protein M5U12_31720 [Verrucomicrobia bacterium]|nr:hypothetical protein [Verrucomicrobiota bacterium]